MLDTLSSKSSPLCQESSISLSWLLSVYFAFLLFQSAFSVLSVLRLLQFYDTSHLIQLSALVIDMVFVASFVLFYPSLRIPKILIPLFLLSMMSTLIGLIHLNFNHSLITDSILYPVFLAKACIVYTVMRHNNLKEKIERFFITFSHWNVFLTVMAVLILLIASKLGKVFYFSYQANITYAFSHALVSSKLAMSYFILALGALAGKRMVFLGIVLVFLLYLKPHIKEKKNVVVLIIMMVMLVGLAAFKVSHDLKGLAKVTNEFPKIIDSLSNSQNGSLPIRILKTFQKLAPARYDGVLGIIKSMRGYDYLTGMGYGFRFFWANHPHLRALNITNANAHFTPMGILSKFGIIGFILWYSLFFYTTYKAFIFRKKGTIQYANFLFLVSILFQSLFAYILFWQPLLPLVIGYTLAERNDFQSKEISCAA